MAIPLQPIATPATKSEAAYAALKEAIAQRILLPGRRLVLDEVARELGVSVGPVREATRRLEAEGLITHTPHVGPTVTEATPAELIADYRILSALSGLAARLATAMLTDSDHAAIERHIDGIDEAVAKQRSSDADEHNLQLHDRINRASGIERLRLQIMNLWTFSIRRHRLMFGLVPGRAAEANDEHRAILRSLRERDALAAEQLMREHLWHSADGFAQHFGLGGTQHDEARRKTKEAA